MSLQTRNIGRIPVYFGDYDPEKTYQEKNRVTLYGSEFQAAKDNPSNAPLTYDPSTHQITSWNVVNGEHASPTGEWYIISNGTDAWIASGNVFKVIYGETRFEDTVDAYSSGKFIYAEDEAGIIYNLYQAVKRDNDITKFAFINLYGDGNDITWFEYEPSGFSELYPSSWEERIEDLSDIRSGAEAGATAYQKPDTGIPASDLASGVIPDVSAFVVTVSIDPEGDVRNISHTISEIDAAYRANKQLRLKCTNAQQGVWFEEDLTQISQTGGSYFYVSHTVTDEGVHYIITIYDDSGTTKAKFEMVDDKAYAKYYDVLINTITPTITSSTVTIDGYTIYPSEETFIVKPYQKIAFSDTKGDCHLYIIDATSPSAKTVMSYKSHLIIWDNQSDTDITIQVGIDNGGLPGTLGVNTYWRGVDNVFVAEYGVTSVSEIESAVDSGRVVMCRAIEDDNIVYYQLSQSSSTSFTFFRFVNARYYRIVLNKSTGVWYTSDDLLQSTANRDSSIDSSASLTHYPSTKAVYDYVGSIVGNIGTILDQLNGE